MAKGLKQPKIKLAQPVALEPRLRDILEKHGVRKRPTVDKVEALQKAATAKKWLFTIREDRKDGLAHATLEVPGPDGLLYFESEAMTIPLAMTHALCDALENGPQQSTFMDGNESSTPPPDPNGSDLPMFRGNGGVAGPIGVNVSEIAGEVMGLVDAELERDPYGPPHGRGNPEDQAAFVAAANADDEDEQVNPWTFLFQLNPADMKAWKEAAPVDGDGTPIVEWEEGDELNDRGFYLDPGFHYDHKAGEIRIKAEDGTPDKLVWSRDVAPKAAKKAAKPQVSNVTPEQADALQLAGAQP